LWNGAQNFLKNRLLFIYDSVAIRLSNENFKDAGRHIFFPELLILLLSITRTDLLLINPLPYSEVTPVRLPCPAATAEVCGVRALD
jgi:hypothetical protein